MPEILLRGFALLAGLVSLVLLFFSVRAMRRERPLSRWRPLISALVVAVVTAGYIVITGAQLNLFMAVGVLFAGLLFGLLEGLFTRVYARGSQVMGRQSGLYVVVWGLAYIATLVLGQLRSGTLHAGGVLAMLLGLGVALSSSIMLVLKIHRLKARARATSVQQPSQQLPASNIYQNQPAQAAGIVCGKCQGVSPAGGAFCNYCGTPLATTIGPQSGAQVGSPRV